MSRHQVSLQTLAGPAPHPCSDAKVTESKYKVLTAQHSKFLDEHSKLAVAISDFVHEMQTSPYTGCTVQANMVKLSADQSLSQLKALTDTCRKMTCYVRTLSKDIQTSRQTNHQQIARMQEQSARSNPSGDCGYYKLDGLHNISEHVMDEQTSTSRSTSATQSGAIAMASPKIPKCNSARSFQSILPVGMHKASDPKKRRCCSNPIRRLLQTTTGKYKISGSNTTNAFATMNLQVYTEDDSMYATLLPNAVA